MTPDARARLGQVAFALCAVAASVPLWLVRYPPIEDLPQHLAAIRVLHSYGDAHFGFAQFFELGLWRTQYLAYYLVTDLLAYALDLELANKLVISACIVATPYAARSLLRAIDSDPRLALLVLPLTYNAHLILGFVNFLAAIPLALWGLALCVQQRVAPKAWRGVLLALVALVCFFAHVVPFLFLALGAGLIALQRSFKQLVLSLAPLLPAAIAASVWIVQSPAGQATLTAAHLNAHAGARTPTFQPWRLALLDAPNWLTAVLQGERDVQLLRAFLALLGLCMFAGLFRRRAVLSPEDLPRRLGRLLWLLPPLAAGLYFVAPTSYDWIWPIAQRFPLLALILAVALLSPQPRFVAPIMVAGALALSAVQLTLVTQAFQNFEAHEVGDFDLALAKIGPAQRVAGLIFARGSRYVKFSPFIHYVAYYQARKGGAVMFTFADFPQSPFQFREGNRPPRVVPRWEWMPERVTPDRDLTWYDYVLVRGGPGLVSVSRDFAPIYRGSLWSVWRKRVMLHE